MTAWEFLRWYAANHDPVQRALVAMTAAVSAVTAACWLALGSARVQRWITGGDLGP